MSGDMGKYINVQRAPGVRLNNFFACPRAFRRGQILLPSLLVVPSLLIFVYLLFETTKISREKIRQQFAVDSAAFIQMGDYTNLFNRTAYVNGPFPYRIFREKYACPPGATYEYDESGPPPICEYQLLYDSGAFPRDQRDTGSGEAPPLDEQTKWEIRFKPGVAVRADVEKNPTAVVNIESFDLTTEEHGNTIKLPWQSVVDIYKFYGMVYGLMGAVEESQWTVFLRLTETFNFFRKSYYLNAGTQECMKNPGACGNDGLRGRGSFYDNKLEKGGKDFLMHHIVNIVFHAKVYTGEWPSPYYHGKTEPPMNMTADGSRPGLFQLATVSDGILKRLGDGLDVYQGWDAPVNYFKVGFNDIAACKETGRPCVHSLITTQCPQLKSAGNNCVWPNPTPKYQTRLYP